MKLAVMPDQRDDEGRKRVAIHVRINGRSGLFLPTPNIYAHRTDERKLIFASAKEQSRADAWMHMMGNEIHQLQRQARPITIATLRHAFSESLKTH